MERRGGIWRRAPFLWFWCKTDLITKYTFFDPPRNGGELDLNSSNRGCARLGGEVAPPLGVVIEEVAVLIVLVRRHRRAVGSAVRRAVGDEVPGAIEEETGPAAVRRVPPGLLDALPVHALGALGIVVVVRDVGPRQIVCDNATDAAHVPRHPRERFSVVNYTAPSYPMMMIMSSA